MRPPKLSEHIARRALRDAVASRAAAPLPEEMAVEREDDHVAAAEVILAESEERIEAASGAAAPADVADEHRPSGV